jgi:PST family polysaccharide transporter
MWTGTAKLCMQGLLLAVSVVLARLLSPDDFGIVGMAGLVTVAIGMVNDRGLGTALVQRKDLPDDYAHSLFWGGLGFGVLFFALFAVGSIPIAYFFHEPILRHVITVQALGFILGSLGMVQKSLLIREMEFKRLSIIEMAAVLISAAVSLSMACLGFGVWSLVALVLVRDLFITLLLWTHTSWKPRPHFRWSEFTDLFRFSAQVLANDIALYVITNTDVTIIGRILGSTLLGYYNWSLNLIKLPITRLSGIVSRVTFPAFSLLQDDLDKFKKGYLKSIRLVSALTFPILAGLALYSGEFIRVFLGDQWLPIQLPLIILTPMGMLKSVGTLKGSVLMAVGRPDIELKWNIFYFVPLVIVLLIGTRFGLVGVSAAFTILYVITFPVIQHITNRQMRVRMTEFLSVLIPASVATGIMVGSGLFYQYGTTFLHFSPLLVLIVGIPLGMIVYVGTIWIVDRDIVAEFISFIPGKQKRSRNQ